MHDPLTILIKQLIPALVSRIQALEARAAETAALREALASETAALREALAELTPLREEIASLRDRLTELEQRKEAAPEATEKPTCIVRRKRGQRSYAEYCKAKELQANGHTDMAIAKLLEIPYTSMRKLLRLSPEEVDLLPGREEYEAESATISADTRENDSSSPDTYEYDVIDTERATEYSYAKLGYHIWGPQNWERCDREHLSDGFPKYAPCFKGNIVNTVDSNGKRVLDKLAGDVSWGSDGKIEYFAVVGPYDNYNNLEIDGL